MVVWNVVRVNMLLHFPGTPHLIGRFL